MSELNSGILPDFQCRLRPVVEAEVRREFQAKLNAATGYWEKVEVKEEIQREIKKRMNALASPQAL